jgi:hypothetical protein
MATGEIKMSTRNENQNVQGASLSDVELVSPQLSERIIPSVSTGNHSIRESYIHRYSTSNAEFAAACEKADDYGLVVH